MPELPEVEIVKLGLEALLKGSHQILKIEMSSKKLRRFPSLKNLAQVKGEEIKGLKRVAKYILFELENFYMISHLGMTGSWRFLEEKRTHDHVRVFLDDGRVLVYHDPRRFGQFDLIGKKLFAQDKRFLHLGFDPVLEPEIDLNAFIEKMKNKSCTIKSSIMDQKNIVGVGNIYANEALFRAQIHPKTPTHQMKLKQWKTLIIEIKNVLFEAIQAGGSTISDFRQAGGSQGYFQNHFFVYGRENQLCRKCRSVIESQPIVGRSSFWCPSCQPYSKIKKTKARRREKSIRKKTT